MPAPTSSTPSVRPFAFPPEFESAVQRDMRRGLRFAQLGALLPCPWLGAGAVWAALVGRPVPAAVLGVLFVLSAVVFVLATTRKGTVWALEVALYRNEPRGPGALLPAWALAEELDGAVRYVDSLGLSPAEREVMIALSAEFGGNLSELSEMAPLLV